MRGSLTLKSFSIFLGSIFLLLSGLCSHSYWDAFEGDDPLGNQLRLREYRLRQLAEDCVGPDERMGRLPPSEDRNRPEMSALAGDCRSA